MIVAQSVVNTQEKCAVYTDSVEKACDLRNSIVVFMWESVLYNFMVCYAIKQWSETLFESALTLQIHCLGTASLLLLLH